MSEPPAKRRGRKRKKKSEDELGQPETQQRVPIALVGRYLKKQFEGRSYLGKIVSYDTGLYRVEYADGDFEDLDSGEARQFLIPENGGFKSKAFLNKKRKLDDFIARKKAKADEKKNLSQEEKSCSGDSDKHAVMKEQPETDMDSSGESCKSHYDSAVAELGHEAETFFVTPLDLPPSTGTIGVPEECVSYLFSVYSFLRSFSIRLFLSPFGLNDFVAALNCRTQNTLLDAIHVALLRLLRRHLEAQSASGSESASKCRRSIEWSLLDSLTWPVYIVQYLIGMRYINGRDWKGFYFDVLEREYYGLSARMKLVVLQMLCDDILDSAELRAELDMREDEQGGDSEMSVIEHSETIPRRGHSKFSKPSAYKDEEALKSFAVIQSAGAQSSVTPLNGKDAHFAADSGSVDQDSNSDECRICGMDGTLLCCDGCPSAYHSRCIGVNKISIPEGAWFCPECEVDKIGSTVSSSTSLKSAEVFGIDSDNRVFLGTCDHLLVLKGFADRDQCLRYYHKYDVIRVLQALSSSKHHITMYSGICKGISQYWQIPEDTYIIPERKEIGAVFSKPEVDISGGSQSSLAVSSSIIDIASRSSSDKSTDNDSPINGMVGRPLQTRVLCSGASGVLERKSYGYTVSNSQASAYTNYYCYGDFAASAAADFAVLSSEENRVLERNASDNIKKALSANVLLQAKAFSSAATRFFWPNPEKKFVEVPKEKCGWCLNCRAPIISKKACLLNVACLSAHRGAMTFLSGLRAIKARPSSLASIAMYMLYMEDSLSALMVGPYLNASYRKQWRIKVGQALNCSALKSYLLDLERNIRDVALSTDWAKLVEDSSSEASGAPDSSCTSTLIPKRGRRPKKPASLSAAADSEDKGDINWWRGGKLSKLLFQKGIIPSPIVRRAARKGGSNKISGICYAADDSGIPRKSRQLVWRAAVEMSKNTAQLALQVRNLDHNLRWSDLNRPEQSSYESKCSEKEASAFRNALICDKRVAGNKISYGVVFGNQKHLPLRVMKYVTDLEHGKDGRDKHWFPETRIPLYLIKEYEASKIEESSQSAERATEALSIRQKKQLKAARSEIFPYLASKRDNLDNCSCTACQLDVLLRDAITCSYCKGFCHADCTVSHLVPPNGGAGPSLTCKECYFGKSTQGGISNSPTSPLLPFKVHGKGDDATKIIRGSNPGATGQEFASLGVDLTHSVVRLKASDSSALKKKKQKIASGLKWKKKKKAEDCGGFLQKNLILRGSQCFESLKPSCLLCQKPYNPDLTYIRCETCQKWYHGDAVELDETKISELIGFKCCKCRRVRSASCPYMDSDKTKPEVSGSYLMDSNLENPGLESYGAVGTPFQEESSSPLCLNTDDIFMDNDDPLLFSLASVTEPCPDSDIGWDDSGSGPKKLPVRRQVKNDCGFDNSSEIDITFEPANGSFFYDTQMHGNVSNDAPQDEMGFDLGNFDYEDMEFEPHTYFSMTELLEDDGEMNPMTSMSDVVPGTYAVNNYYDQQTYSLQGSQNTEIMKCQLCARTEPLPDLSCEICHVSVHRGCSPVMEDPSMVDGWRCVSCREWQ